MRALGIKELDTAFRVGCSVPGCCFPHNPARDRSWIHATCHVRAPTWAYYVAGVLVIECSRCHRTIVTIRLAVEGTEVDLTGL